ncbi:hypothetical protein ACCO45_003305 [Purpureocillium lilacinum]|uniref:Uncharacterized protein n=1 Tax=Purpureocillium lilacinum TaxID=33203 RepID=A0ACC4E0H1_PURLI
MAGYVVQDIISPASSIRSFFLFSFSVFSRDARHICTDSSELLASSRSLSAMSSAPSTPAGHFNVLYFASASSFTGKEQEALPAPMPLGKLFAELEARHPGLKAKILDSCLVTVNLDYVDVPADGSNEGAVIQEADEVAIIPPVSSG